MSPRRAVRIAIVMLTIRGIAASRDSAPSDRLRSYPGAAAMTTETEDASPHGAGSLKDVLRYFLYLGTFGFGGPIALAGYMQRDLVEKRGWISKKDYVDGLALAQLA